MKQDPEYLVAAFAVLDQAVLMIDRRSRRIVDLNPAAERLLGESAPDVRGRSIDELVRFLDGPGEGAEQRLLLVSPASSARAGSGPAAMLGPMSCKVAPVHGADGVVVGEVVVFAPVVPGTASGPNAYWQRLVRESPHIACLVDGQGNFHMVSDGLAGALGFELEDMVGQPVQDFLHPDDLERAQREWMEQMRRGGDSIAIENRYHCKSGSYLWLSWYAIGDPATGAVYGVASDITERKLEERMFKETESAARIGGWEVDLATRAVYWTEETYRLHDTSPEQYTPTLDSAIAFYAEEYRDRITRAVQRALEGEPFDIELELITTTGRRIACRATGRAAIEAGKVAHIYGAFQDITAQHQVQKALRDSEERLRSIVRDMSTGLVVHGPDATILMTNPAALDTLGLTEEQVLGKTPYDEGWHAIEEDGSILSPDSHPGALALRTGQSVTGRIMGVYRPRTRDHAWIVVNAVVQRDDAGDIVRVVVSFIDITDRKRAEDAARDSHAMFRAVYDNAGSGVLLRDPSGEFIECNPTLERMLGHGSQQLRAMGASGYVHADDRQPPAELHAALMDGRRESYEFERRFVRADGEIMWGHVTVSLACDPDGAPRCIVEMITDITDRKRMETQLLLADRMASLGTMAAGVGHEINNPLTWIMGNVSFSLDLLEEAGGSIDADAASEIRAALDEAMSGAERVRTIVRDLKLFSRIEDAPGAVAAPNQVIQSTTRMLGNEINHRASLILDLGDVPPVVGDEARIGQVLTNLLINAVQALPDRNRDDNVIRVRSRFENEGVLIDVSDNGPGIPPEVQSHIFDPFFTTKAVGVGTGLGLSICHSIVTRLGGRIELDSTPGQGTTFRIWLVPASGREEAAQPDQVEDAPAEPKKRILCVDDEIDVGRLIARILRERHDVVIETDGARALSRLRAGEHYDAIICDLMMPSMSGMDLYHELQASMPELARRCGFITGGVFTTAARTFAATLPPSRLVEKPFRGSVIHELVSHLLD